MSPSIDWIFWGIICMLMGSCIIGSALTSTRSPYHTLWEMPLGFPLTAFGFYLCTTAIIHLLPEHNLGKWLVISLTIAVSGFFCTIFIRWGFSKEPKKE